MSLVGGGVAGGVPGGVRGPIPGGVTRLMVVPLVRRLAGRRGVE